MSLPDDASVRGNGQANAGASIRAIPTRYKGYYFRSRLEARWAVFFNELGVQWEYEPEGFALRDGTHYLPDFRVTSPQGQTTWYEVKPLSGATASKMNELEQAWGVALIPKQDGESAEEYDRRHLKWVTTSFVTLEGDPFNLLTSKPSTWNDWAVCPRCGLIDIHNNYENGQAVICSACDWATPFGGGNSADYPGLLCSVHAHEGVVGMTTGDARAFYAFVGSAAIAARSARFEFGESGAG